MLAAVPDATPYAALARHLVDFADLSPADLRLAEPYWTRRTLGKNEFFNFRNSVCQHVGFIVQGLFRVYYVDEAAQEHTLIFLREGELLASLKSMLTQEACPFYIAALEDSELLIISNLHLRQLYAASHGWERFGRLLAEHYLVFNQGRTEALLFQSAEQRYLTLLAQFPGITNRVSLGHIASYLGIQGPSLSRIRARLG